MPKKKKKDPGLPTGPKITIFFRGDLVKGVRAKDGSVYGENGHRYLADETGKYHYADGTLEVTRPKYTIADLGRFISRVDGMYQVQEFDGEFRAVKVLGAPAPIVSLSLDNIHRYGRYPASRTKVTR